MKNPLTIHSDASESLHYNVDDFPLYTHKDLLSNYDYKALIHWHPDLEFIYVQEGTMDFYVNGNIVSIKQGQALFINSQRMHYGFSDRKKECIFIALVISPEIFIHISTSVKDYMHQKFGLKNTDYVLLSPDISYQNEIINIIMVIYDSMKDFSRPLLIISKAIEIIDKVGELIDDCSENNLNSYDQDLFLNMTTYISKHYSENITIDSICKVSGISRNKCCKLFKQFTHNTFIHYLTYYRLDKSIHYLQNSHLSILEISQLCGFSSSSYFTSVFKKKYGYLPKEIRKNALLKER